MDPTCKLCRSAALKQVLMLAKAPRTISRLLRPEELAQDHGVDLRVFQCGSCGFVQLIQTLQDDYYDDYLMTATHSTTMQTYQREQVADFVGRFGLQGRRVVEIGCGDGHYLSLLTEAGAEVVGVEPSSPFRLRALERGLRVHAGYVTEAEPAPEGPFEAVVARQVLEHVPDPLDFLLGVRASLADGGVGLIEVPSLEQAYEQCRFYDFFADHLNYFSARTLRYALERCGFDVVETSRGMNGEFNVALVRAAERFDFQRLRQTIDTLAADITAFRDGIQAAGGRIAVWGAGGKGLASMAALGVEGFAYLVDSDPLKIGAFTPVTHLPIVPPSRLRDDPVEAVVVTALAYRDEILRQIREELGFRGPIAFLGPRLDVCTLEP